jgi:uncharacterized protein YwlG (UPF0340 family)
VSTYPSGLDKMTETELDDAGEVGWELVSVVPVAESGGETNRGYYYFKRPKEQVIQGTR